MVELTVTVRDDTNGEAPISGASLEVKRDDGSSVGSYTTDGSGQVALSLDEALPLKLIATGTTQQNGSQTAAVKIDQAQDVEIFLNGDQ